MSKKTIREMSVPEVQKTVAHAVALVDEIESLLPGLVTLPDEERRTSDGRLRTGEIVALNAILDVAALRPNSFEVLADKDGGNDPKVFEVGFLRDGLARASTLDELATDLEQLARNVRDTQLAIAGDARRPVLAAYDLAKPIAKHDSAVQTKLAPALNFYAQPARQAAKTRAAKKAEAASGGTAGSKSST